MNINHLRMMFDYYYFQNIIAVQGLVLEQHVLPSHVADVVACKEAMLKPLDVVIGKQGTSIHVD